MNDLPTSLAGSLMLSAADSRAPGFSRAPILSAGGHKRKHFLLFVRGLGFDIPGQALVDLLEQKLQLFASLPDRVDRAPGAMDIE
ncbi:MAG TPA: hypothetical protein VFJ56_02885 [Nitrospira sp.]|nr:hypothetical protein [Nitrospira sp.]